MDRLKALSVFKAVADNGSFAEAALALDISWPSASRTVQDLEGMLGVRLMHRTTRRRAASVLRRAHAGQPPQCQRAGGGWSAWRRRRCSPVTTWVLADAAAHGAGIVMLPTLVAKAAVFEGRLRRILPGWRVASQSLRLTYNSRRNQPMSVRKLIEHLVYPAVGTHSKEATHETN